MSRDDKFSLGWPALVAAMGHKECVRAAEWRGYEGRFVQYLVAGGCIGWMGDSNGPKVALRCAVDDQGQIARAQVFIVPEAGRQMPKRRRWYEPKIGPSPGAFVFKPDADAETTACFIGESAWDVLAIAQGLGVHQGQWQGACFIATMGAGNRIPIELITKGVSIFLIVQNDTASSTFAVRAQEAFDGHRVSVLTPPIGFKDPNDHLRAIGSHAFAQWSEQKIKQPQGKSSKQPLPLAQAVTQPEHMALASTTVRNGSTLLARSLFAIQKPAADDHSELIRCRYLCRGGGALLVGPTGHGKSSLTMQMMLCFAIGRPCFGIQPKGPLKCLLVQAENDDGDIAEARDGAEAWLDLVDDGERQMLTANTMIATENALAGVEFLSALDELVVTHKPDIVFLDPAFAYIRGDNSNAEDVSEFLRRGINPLLARHQCGCFIIHHTGKPPNMKGAGPSRDITAYAAAGSSEWANWARAVLALEPLGAGKYKLHAAKRGARLKWQTDSGERAFFKVLEHTTNPAGFAWEEVCSNHAILSTKPESPGLTELLALVPAAAPIAKQVLILKAQTARIGANRARALIEEAIEKGVLFPWKEKRARTNPRISLARFAQPEEEKTTATVPLKPNS